ncbi:hypothetical protein N480_06585 [Pseudoalteromonas luteoviolacea S2607]|uniref:hypothetical protein n=1 Tax=Pseudoalteromonas luteoviolacea TaxID=43657 RepID=UPI0007B17581|nr:hypothetical protein [Pseudoalteromonas luteoviolacea]KZN30623.1 hypothetical protein N480_06585 [Pseudoalteromonas luteoviolacea S2607]
MNTKITLNNISHHFTIGRDKFQLFDDFSATIEANHPYAIVRPSGVGKTVNGS